MFDNVSKRDKVRITVTSPVRLARSFVEFNQLYVLPTVKHVKGWWSVGFVYMGLVNNSTITMKDGSKVRFNKNNVTELISKMRAIDISEETKKIFKVRINGDTATLHAGGSNLKVGVGSLHTMVGELSTEPHKDMDVKDKVVVDIGAYTGDTALYYATKGRAKMVYAYELFPSISKKAEANVRMSKWLIKGFGSAPFQA